MVDTAGATSASDGSTYYYEKNQILLPEWSDARRAKRFPWAWVTIAALLAACGAYFLWGWSTARNLKQSTVMVMVDANNDGKIDVGDRQGSGVIISPKGYVLTCRHVLMDAAQSSCGYVQVWFRPGTPQCEQLDAVLVNKGEVFANEDPNATLQRDWAVLQVKRPQPLPCVGNSQQKDAKEEQQIKAAGFPLGWETATNKYGPAVKLLNGRLTRVDRNEEQAVVRLTHDAELAEGMSGGPLVRGGKLIGLNAQIQTGGQAHENYALPTYQLEENVFSVYARR